MKLIKVRYDREEAILMIKVSDESIDYAEEVGPIIVHLTKGGKPVLLEIMDASEFLAETTKITAKPAGEGFVEISL